MRQRGRCFSLKLVFEELGNNRKRAVLIKQAGLSCNCCCWCANTDSLFEISTFYFKMPDAFDLGQTKVNVFSSTQAK